MAAGQPVGHRPEPVEELRETSGQVDAGAADVVERQRRAEEPVGVVADRHPGQHPVEAEAPGVLDVLLEAERLPVGGVEGPADPGLLDPVGDRLEVGVGEPEASPHGSDGQQVEHPAGLGPTARELEELPDDGEQRVGLGQRTVGQPHPQLVARVAADLAHPEGGRDERRVGLDVGAHHQDVAGLEGAGRPRAGRARTSRSTSTWRAGPWHACTWTRVVVGLSVREVGSTVALAAMSCCSQASRVSLFGG